MIEKRSEVIAMCLFKFDKDKYEDTLKREAKNEGKIEALLGLVKNGLLTIQQAAEQMGMYVDKLEKEAKNLALL